MKKILLFAMLLLPQLLVTQEIYDTYLKDGKQWVYKHHVIESECTDPDHEAFSLGDWKIRDLYFQSYITVMGDTVRGQDTYKKLYFTDSYRDTTYLIATIGERRGLYYIYNEYGSHVSYNFDLEVGDKNTPYSNQFSGNPDNPLLYVKSKDTIQVGDRYFERLSFSYKDNGSQFYPADPNYIMDVWIRGIGNRNEGVYGPFYNEMSPTGFWYSNGHWLIESRQFLACYEDGECIFSNTDFNANPVTGIMSQKRYRSSETAIYDLSGRRVANSSESQGSSFKLPKGVYIQNGKKFVVK